MIRSLNNNSYRHCLQYIIIVAITQCILFVPYIGAQKADTVIGPNDFPFKVITNQPCRLHNLSAHDSPSSPCEAFRIFYVLPPKKDISSQRLADLKQKGFYRVASGNCESESRGWLHEKYVNEWRSTQAIQLNARQGRALVHFFPTLPLVCEALRTGLLKGALYREPQHINNSKAILMPVLEVSSCTVNEKRTKVCRCAFISASRGQIKQADAHDALTTGDNLHRNISVDIVFVVDTTSSMSVLIPHVSRILKAVVNRLNDDAILGSLLRFGLVEYRDQINDMESMEYVIKPQCNLEQGRNHNFFLQKLLSLKTAKIGSEGHPEDVLAGLHCALDPKSMKWNPYGLKLIVIVGDSSIKEPFHPDEKNRINENQRTIDQIKVLAQNKLDNMPMGIVITAIRLKDPIEATDHSIGDRQFENLITVNKSNGWIISARGGIKPEDFSSQLTQKILNSVDHFRETILTNGREMISFEKNPNSNFSPPMLECIAKVKIGSQKNVSLFFDSCYTAEFDAQGNRLVTPCIFVSKGQLHSYVSFWEYLERVLKNTGEPGDRNLNQIMGELQYISAIIDLDEPISASMPIEKFVQAIMEIPIKIPIFKVSLSQLSGMPEKKYKEWLREIHASCRKFNDYLRMPIWFKLHPKAAVRHDHAFIQLADLPGTIDW